MENPWKLYETTLQIGVPMGLQYSITAIGSLVITAAVNALGSTAVAGVMPRRRLVI